MVTVMVTLLLSLVMMILTSYKEEEKGEDDDDNDNDVGFASHRQVLLEASHLLLTHSPIVVNNAHTHAHQANQQAKHVPTSGGVVRAVMEGWDLRVLFQALEPVLELQAPLLIQGPDRFAKVSVAGCRMEV